ncbi:hypothetical protein QOT17_004468 [Balamuthia mandrillaris]
MNKLVIVLVATLALLASCQAAAPITRETRNNAEAACLEAFPQLTPEQCSELADTVAELWFLNEDSPNALSQNLQTYADNTLTGGDCDFGVLLTCATKIGGCAAQCHDVPSCMSCLGESWTTCCPCIKEVIHVDINC